MGVLSATVASTVFGSWVNVSSGAAAAGAVALSNCGSRLLGCWLFRMLGICHDGANGVRFSSGGPSMAVP